MPEVILRGPSHRLEIDDKVLERDGVAVELTAKQLTRAKATNENLEVVEARTN